MVDVAPHLRGQDFLKSLIEQQPDLTLEEIAQEYQKPFPKVSTSTIDRTLRKLNLTRKKKSLFEPNKNTPSKKTTKLSNQFSPI